MEKKDRVNNAIQIFEYLQPDIVQNTNAILEYWRFGNIS
jgi:hypothetical protein